MTVLDSSRCSFSQFDGDMRERLAKLQVLRKPHKKITKCLQLFEIVVIAWNGDLILCCKDFYHEYVLGNLLENSLEEIMDSTKFKAARKGILKRSLPLCSKCDAYKSEVKYVECTQG